MIKAICLFIFILANTCAAQSYKVVDSLLVVKEYIMEISNAIPDKESNSITKGIQLLERLINQGTAQKIIFENQLNKILKNDLDQKTQLLKQYNLVLQSAILLKTDLIQNNYLYNASSLKEAQYLSRACAKLIDKIYNESIHYKSKSDIKRKK